MLVVLWEGGGADHGDGDGRRGGDVSSLGVKELEVGRVVVNVTLVVPNYKPTLST